MRQPPPEVLAYYERFPEESRLTVGTFRLEFERTKELLSRELPSPPGPVIDVGGAAGAYAAWLAEQGYEVHLVDASRRLVEQARRLHRESLASITCADARSLPQSDGSAGAVLALGPLYHLPSAADRHVVLREAFRVLRASGVIFAAGISRYASALDGLVRKLTLDPTFVAIRDRDLVDGQHRNDGNHPDYFTTAYFHRPEDLRVELIGAGFEDVNVLGVEGPGWMVPDFDARWQDPVLRRELIAVARALESEPAVVGVSPHLLAIGRKPA